MSEQSRQLRNQLLELVNKHAVIHGDFVLTSGQKSTYYIDGKLLSLMPDGLLCLAQVILEMIAEDEVDAVGGLTLGADPIIGAVVALSQESGRPLKGLIVRKERSGHGRTKRIEGPLQQGMKVVVIEDVVTTGSSSITAGEALEEAGSEIVKVVAMVDRLAGGQENFKAKGYRFEPIFTLDDLNI
ncbi:MAG: orotate phosphoribosyltransferase [candidate division Zixibacteria bacterium]|nr:orotate phosphoribosyltransferase [candidate division Zixibacteria bacterium]